MEVSLQNGQFTVDDAEIDICENFADSDSEEEDFGDDLNQVDGAGIGPGTLGYVQGNGSDSADVCVCNKSLCAL